MSRHRAFWIGHGLGVALVGVALLNKPNLPVTAHGTAALIVGCVVLAGNGLLAWLEWKEKRPAAGEKGRGE